MKLSFILLGLTHAESFGTVKSNSAEVKVKSSNVEPNRADQSDQVKMLEARAEQGCPHARKQLDEMAAKSAKINIKPKTPDPQLAELEARAASGCPHAKELLAKMKSGTATEEEVEGGCGCSGTNRIPKDEPSEKGKKEESGELAKPDDTFPDKRYNDEILIPKGTFTMGSDEPIIPEDGESPAVQQTLTYDYYFDKYEVANAEFYRFAYETGYITEAEKFGDSFCFHLFIPAKTLNEIKLQVQDTPWWLPVQGADWLHPVGPESDLSGRWDHPVVHVSYNDAAAYCKWADKRLPTEVEWERASRGPLEGRIFAWGNNERPKGQHFTNIWQGKFPDENTKEDGYGSTAPVDHYPEQNKTGLQFSEILKMPIPETQWGVHGVIGNVWEWTSSWWSKRHTPLPKTNDSGPPQGTDRVKKGGSFLCTTQYCYRYRNAARAFNTEDSSAQNLGFRCARTVPGQEPKDEDKFNSEYVAQLEERAKQGCPHANGVLKSLQAQGKYSPPSQPSIDELETRAAQGCPHAKAMLAAMSENEDKTNLDELETRAAQGCPHAKAQLAELKTNKKDEL